ncbi:hypothetical protein, partial [Streptococcus pseudopneumoniae]
GVVCGFGLGVILGSVGVVFVLVGGVWLLGCCVVFLLGVVVVLGGFGFVVCVCVVCFGLCFFGCVGVFGLGVVVFGCFVWVVFFWV